MTAAVNPDDLLTATALPPQIERDANGLTIYRPDGATLRGFLHSNARVRIAQGPIRSGTSSMCCQEIWRRACEQAKGPDGIRRTRWCVVRNSYPDLQQSTIKTWLAWFPEGQFGRFLWSKPMVHHVRKGDVYAEVVFLALDKPEDVQKLMSTEWTGGWINEGQFIDKAVFDELTTRVGYYPALKDGGPTWSGVIVDMNAPAPDHWIALMTGKVPFPDEMGEEERRGYAWPEGWEFYEQPAALTEVIGPDGKTVVGYELNPLAENLRWIPKVNGRPLYLEAIKGKTKAWIDSRLMNRVVVYFDGEPIWPAFKRETHEAKVELRANPNYTLQVGLDFGRRPAAVFGQIINNRWVILDEIGMVDAGASVFAPRVKRFIKERFPDHYERYFDTSRSEAGRREVIRFWGDPKGNDKVQSDERTAYDIWQDKGMPVDPAPVKQNNIETRVETVAAILNEMVDGFVRLLVSPRCRTLVMGMAGGYHNSKVAQKAGELEPVKDRYADFCDALQYLLIGGGESRVLVGLAREGRGQPVKTNKGRRSLRRVRG